MTNIVISGSVCFTENNSSNVWNVNTDGSFNNNNPNNTYGFRPDYRSPPELVTYCLTAIMENIVHDYKETVPVFMVIHEAKGRLERGAFVLLYDRALVNVQFDVEMKGKPTWENIKTRGVP